MILVDTSAWVEYDRRSGSDVDLHLTQLIADTDDVAVTEPVIMEVVAGARDDRRADQLRRLMRRFHLLRFDPIVDFNAAERIYRTCRRAGITPRGLIDCLIASVALRHNAALLAVDGDLRRVSETVGIAWHLA